MDDHIAPIILSLVFGGMMILVYATLVTAAVLDGRSERRRRRLPR